jgi:deoxyribose-phosphate aldolase
MSQEGQIDHLVDEIARRVRARLLQDGATLAPAAASSSPAGEAKGGACKGGGEKCDSCRGCHVNRPAEVRDFVKLGAARIGAGAGHDAPASDLAPLIDHTLLRQDATREDLKKLCDEARRYGFATVCVNSSNVRFCASLLEGSSVKAIAVVGFPLGAATAGAKAYETREAVRNGAQEIDMVINIGALKSKDYALVLEDICTVVGAASGKPVKVILETGALTRDQKVIACALSKVAGAAFVKTSTGFGPGGATAEDLALMRETVGPEMGVKASGGVRTEEDARKFVAAGATRLGASASVAIVTGGAKADKSKAKRVGGY